MNCPKCGKEIPDGSKFCQFCGEKIQLPVENAEIVEEENAKTLSKKAKGWIIAGASVLLLIILYVGTYLVSWHSAASYDFTKASKWLILPAVTELHDSGFPEYVNQGLLYEQGYFAAARKAFQNYPISDNDLSLKERYNKALNQLEYGNYDDALATIKPLVEQGYKDSLIIQEEANCLKALKYAEEKKYNLALEMLKKLKDDGYPKATDYIDNITKDAYDYAIEKYHEKKYSDAGLIFEKIDYDYKDTRKYRILTNMRSSFSHIALLAGYDYEDLYELIGFEDAGEVIFWNGWTASKFMIGTFAGSGYSIKTWEDDDGYHATWSIPGIASGQWYYDDGLFYTGDTPRMTIKALTKDSIEIVVLSDRKTYTLTRQ